MIIEILLLFAILAFIYFMMCVLSLGFSLPYTAPAPFLLTPFVAFASHHRCYWCNKPCYTWQNCFRPSDAYHDKCFEEKCKIKN